MTTVSISLPSPAWNWPSQDVEFKNEIFENNNVSDNTIQELLNLLCVSLSLSIDEKKRVITSINTLSLFQVDELINVLSEEKNQFKSLYESGHIGDIAKLVGASFANWLLLFSELFCVKDSGNKIILEFSDVEYVRKMSNDYSSWARITYFWLGFISVMNTKELKNSVSIALVSLESSQRSQEKLSLQKK